MTQKNRYPVIVGPTASGKSALAVSLAHKLCGEVVSADSMQIYDTIRIGTARPTVEEMDGIPHHLVGFLPLSAPYSVAQYVTDAKAKLEDISGRGKLPIICGGTGLYVQSLIENVTFSVQATSNAAVREKLRRQFDTDGGEALLAELARIDPVTAQKLHANDAGRIIRALEVYQTTGQTISEQVALSHKEPPAFDTCLIMLDFQDREKLYARIHKRVDQMVQDGLLDEAQAVLSGPYAPTAMQAIGYKELKPYFNGTISKTEALDNLKKSTRHYAKRQLSWFRRMQDVQVLYVDAYRDIEALTAAAMTIWQQNSAR